MLTLGQKLVVTGAVVVVLLPVLLLFPWWLAILGVFAAGPFLFAVFTKL